MTGLQMSCEIHLKFKLTDLSLQADFRAQVNSWI